MPQYISDDQAREQICEFGRRLYNRGLVGSNEGNLCLRVGPNEAWVTPTGESKGFLTPDMLIKVDLDFNVLYDEGYKASSETRVHLGVMKQDESIMATVHAHPICATAYAAAGEDIPGDLLPESIFLFGECIHCADFAFPGTDAVPASVIPYVKGNCVCLMGNHGAIAWGKSMKDAYFNMEALENYCRTRLIATQILRKQKPIPEEAAAKILANHYHAFR